MKYRGEGDKQEWKDDDPMQSGAGSVDAYTKHFYVKDSKHPYTFDEDEPFLWVRGYQLGGRGRSRGAGTATSGAT